MAVILGSSMHGLSFSRSLGQRDVPTLLLDETGGSARYSRFGRHFVLPSVEKNPHEWISFLEYIGARMEKQGALFVTSDAFLLFLSRYRHDIEKFFHFLIPAPETVEQIVNKRSQYGIAEKAGIALPRTLFPESVADLQSSAAQICYPAILKPYDFKGQGAIGKKAILVHTPSELIQEFSKLSDYGQKFMIQEVVPGDSPSLFAYHGFWDRGGKEVAWWTKQHLRGTQFGAGALHITANVPEVAALSRRLLSAFGYCGFSHVEFKLDPRDKVYRLMEINARTGQSTQQGIAAGVDLPWLGYLHLTQPGEADVSSCEFQEGIRFMNENHAQRLWRSGNVSFSTCCGWFIRAEAKAYWARNDPGPLIGLIWYWGSSSFSRWLSRVFQLFRRPP